MGRCRAAREGAGGCARAGRRQLPRHTLPSPAPGRSRSRSCSQATAPAPAPAPARQRQRRSASAPAPAPRPCATGAPVAAQHERDAADGHSAHTVAAALDHNLLAARVLDVHLGPGGRGVEVCEVWGVRCGVWSGGCGGVEGVWGRGGVEGVWGCGRVHALFGRRRCRASASAAALLRGGPATSHQPPATSHQPPATGQQPAASSHQPAATSHQPPATSHQQPPAATSSSNSSPGAAVRAP